jgi:hypothetical protein
MRQRLNPEQRQCIDRLAQERGTVCTKCGSTDLSSRAAAEVYQGGIIDVELWCNKAAAHPEGATQPLTLSVHEARRCGIDIT